MARKLAKKAKNKKGVGVGVEVEEKKINDDGVFIFNMWAGA